MNNKVYDLRLLNASSITISGPSMCGKTVFTKSLIEHSNVLFQQPFAKIFWYAAYMPDKNDQLENVTYAVGLPDSFDDKPPLSCIVLDDLMMEAQSNDLITNLIIKAVHHKKLTVITLTQNMFQDSKHVRTRNLNCHYLVLFKNPRNKHQVHSLQTQMHPSDKNLLLKSYEDSTNTPYGYLFLDFHQTTSEYLRIRSRILPNELPMRVYIGYKYLNKI
jgi:hypothetical protein